MGIYPFLHIIKQSVKQAFQIEERYQEQLEIKFSTVIDGYSDFIFVNCYGHTQHQGTLNKAILRIMGDCNDEVSLKDENDEVVLLHFVGTHLVTHLKHMCVKRELI